MRQEAQHSLTDYDLHQDDPVRDSLYHKYLLYPLLSRKPSNTSSTFAVSRPVWLVPGVFTLNNMTLTFSDQYRLYLESLPLIVRQ